MSFVPANSGEIEAAWLTEALQPRHPGARVEAVELADSAEVTNSHAWLRIRYAADSAPGPAALFGKLLPNDPTRRVAIAHTQMGLREAKFYDALAPSLSMRVPEAHVVRYEEDQGGAFVILLEDLNASGCTVSSWSDSPQAKISTAFTADPAKSLRTSASSCSPTPAAGLPTTTGMLPCTFPRSSTRSTKLLLLSYLIEGDIPV